MALKNYKPLSSFLLILFAGLFVSTASRPSGPKNKIELGKLLFEEKMLSLDSSISCASCHRPEFAFADTSALSPGVGGQLGNRNTPSAMNMLSRPYFFYDGRAATLAEQALGPIANPVEMNLPVDQALKRLNNHLLYKRAFQKIYRSEANAANLGDALQAFQETLESGRTPFDRWVKGDSTALSTDAVAGRQVFMNKGKCFDCHFGPDFTGDEFRNIGLYNGKEWNDTGRFAITKDSSDLGKFKTPGLRNVAVTGPYMHNGSFKTLKEVIDFYDQPDAFVPDALQIDSLMKEPLVLSSIEKRQLLAFLESLTEDRYAKKINLR
jgi:cytochrome c peroxidase